MAKWLQSTECIKFDVEDRVATRVPRNKQKTQKTARTFWIWSITIPMRCTGARLHGMIAALVRRNGESFNDLVLRLDHAVDMAMNHGA